MTSKKEKLRLENIALELRVEDIAMRPSGVPGSFVAFCQYHRNCAERPIKGSFSKPDLEKKIKDYVEEYNNRPERMEAIEALSTPPAKKVAKPLDLSALPWDLAGSLSNFQGKEYLFITGAIEKYRPHLETKTSIAKNGALQVSGVLSIKKILKELSDSTLIESIEAECRKKKAIEAETIAGKKLERENKKRIDIQKAVEAEKAAEIAMRDEINKAVASLGRSVDWDKGIRTIRRQRKDSKWEEYPGTIIQFRSADFYVYSVAKPYYASHDWLADNSLDGQEDPGWKTVITGVLLN